MHHVTDAPNASRQIHRFEAAGLGRAPFEIVGQSILPGQGGSCDYCATGIKNAFWIKSADGRSFKVGCDCVRKTDDAGLIGQLTKAEAALKQEKRTIKWDRDALRIKAAKERLGTVRGRLMAQPHPVPGMAAEGRTLFDYVEWMLKNAGRSGAIRVSRIIEEA